jgi:hypothetical protein
VRRRDVVQDALSRSRPRSLAALSARRRPNRRQWLTARRQQNLARIGELARPRPPGATGTTTLGCLPTSRTRPARTSVRLAQQRRDPIGTSCAERAVLQSSGESPYQTARVVLRLLALETLLPTRRSAAAYRTAAVRYRHKTQLLQRRARRSLRERLAPPPPAPGNARAWRSWRSCRLSPHPHLITAASAAPL